MIWRGDPGPYHMSVSLSLMRIFKFWDDVLPLRVPIRYGYPGNQVVGEYAMSSQPGVLSYYR